MFMEQFRDAFNSAIYNPDIYNNVQKLSSENLVTMSKRAHALTPTTSGTIEHGIQRIISLNSVDEVMYIIGEKVVEGSFAYTIYKNKHAPTPRQFKIFMEYTKVAKALESSGRK
jgi:hypothetical protein